MSDILCSHCTAVCCRYIALPIETPTERSDFDDIRWYLIHHGVSVFVEDGDWYIAFQATCRHLLPDYRCGIYETRPKICRSYTTDNCDYHSGDYGWEQHFTSAEHLDEFLKTWSPKKRGAKGGRAGETPKTHKIHGRTHRTRGEAANRDVDGGKKRSPARDGAAARRRTLRRMPLSLPTAALAMSDRTGVPLPILKL